MSSAKRESAPSYSENSYKVTDSFSICRAGLNLSTFIRVPKLRNCTLFLILLAPEMPKYLKKNLCVRVRELQSTRHLLKSAILTPSNHFSFQYQ